MTLKDVIGSILVTVAVAIVAVFSSMIDTIPIRILVVVASILWAFWMVLIALEFRANRKKTLWIGEGDYWVAMDGSNRRVAKGRLNPPPTNLAIFDQDEYAEKENA